MTLETLEMYKFLSAGVTNKNCICPRYTGESTRHLSGPS